MKTKLSRYSLHQSARAAALVSAIACITVLTLAISFSQAMQAQTLVCGSINTATWTPTGNPYVIGCDSTVPSGQTLTIRPGVVVWIGSNVTLTVNGSIQALGLPGGSQTNRIIFSSVPSSQNWNSIKMNYSGSTNRFKYCDFQNGTRALSLSVYHVDATMYAEVMNCTFTNCSDAAIYGESEGTVINTYGYPTVNPVLFPVIKNCTIVSGGDGCRFFVKGSGFSTCCPGSLHIGSGGAAPQVMANTFVNISGTALSLTTGNYAKPSTASFLNNTLVNCVTGVASVDPWTVKVQNCIFQTSNNALKTSGSSSHVVSYNNFHGNATNFSGYPSLFGQPILTNRNGKPCDLFYNIFDDPQFVSTNDFHLASTSPCVDAGASEQALCDICLSNSPSKGTAWPDLGAYGGPEACNWLDVVPRIPTSTSILKTNGLTQLRWLAVPRSEYQIQYVDEFLGTNSPSGFVMTNKWLNLTNGRVLATQAAMSATVPGNAQKRFFRLQSLGRTPGN